jgi:hypothetical protein
MDMETALTHVRLELGQKRLNRAWAKAEILVGLLVGGLGLLTGIRGVSGTGDYRIYTSQDVRESAEGFVATQKQNGFALAERDVSWFQAIAGLALIVLGGYLALAGHRSHLYLSGNELTAYLAELIRSTSQPVSQGERG